MQLVTEQALARYLSNDKTSAWMDAFSDQGDADLVCQKWLCETPAKRLIFEQLYGDLITGGRRLRVLDVGGGLTCFTRAFGARHDYELVDLLAHDDEDTANRMKSEVSTARFHQMDWHDFHPDGQYDVVIANDLFPNVDQRLQLFLQKFHPLAREIRLSLTYYPQPRFYMTRRIVGDEYLCMLAWDGEATARALEPFKDHLHAPDLTLFRKENQSVYANGRQVCIMAMSGADAGDCKDRNSGNSND